jgi:hypothetical protein
MANVAINGLGRIGRATLKVVMDTPGLNLVAANDLAGADTTPPVKRWSMLHTRTPGEVGQPPRISFPRQPVPRPRRPRRSPSGVADSMAWPSGCLSLSGRLQTSSPSLPGGPR